MLQHSHLHSLCRYKHDTSLFFSSRMYCCSLQAIRIISYAEYKAHSKPLFLKYKILTVYDLCLTHMLHFVYISLQCLLPDRYNNYFVCPQETHRYSTRAISKHNLYVHRAIKLCRYNSLRIRGVKYWNNLPYSLKNLLTLGCLKHSWKCTCLIAICKFLMNINVLLYFESCDMTFRLHAVYLLHLV